MHVFNFIQFSTILVIYYILKIFLLLCHGVYNYSTLLKKISRIRIFYLRPEALVFTLNAAHVSQKVGQPPGLFYIIIKFKSKNKFNLFQSNRLSYKKFLIPKKGSKYPIGSVDLSTIEAVSFTNNTPIF